MRARLRMKVFRNNGDIFQDPMNYLGNWQVASFRMFLHKSYVALSYLLASAYRSYKRVLYRFRVHIDFRV